jgi:aldose 1-epimerase
VADNVFRLASSDRAIEVLPLGASLHRFEVMLADGSWRNIVLSRPDPTQTDAGYFGASVGRVVNRLAEASIDVDGQHYQLAANEGRNQVHGGPRGFSELAWTVLSSSPEQVQLQLISPDGDQGFPGELTVVATFALIPGGAQVTYVARTDAPTVVNLAAHPYFRLGGETIESHRLTMQASRYTPVRPDLIPTGEIRDVTGSSADFRAGVLLGEALARSLTDGVGVNGGFDHNFVIDGTGLREHLRLRGPDGLTLVVSSDAPAVQLYSGEKQGRAGLAIEPQGFPDAPNQPTFPNIVLRPGQEYRTTTMWVVQEG